LPPPPPTPPPAPASPPGQIDLDTGAIDRAPGTKGTNAGGIYQFSFARKDGVSAQGKSLPPGMGVTIALNFQPISGGKAAINGDFAMTADEVQKVIQALRAGDIDIVDLHNHTFDENPRLSSCTSWPTTTTPSSPKRCARPSTPKMSHRPADTRRANQRTGHSWS
jgi:hypothetical protein